MDGSPKKCPQCRGALTPSQPQPPLQFSLSRALFQAPGALVCPCPFPHLLPQPPPLGLALPVPESQLFPSGWTETGRLGPFCLFLCPAFAPSRAPHLPAGWLVLDAVSLFLPRMYPPPSLIPSSGLCGLINLRLVGAVGPFCLSSHSFLSQRRSSLIVLVSFLPLGLSSTPASFSSRLLSSLSHMATCSPFPPLCSQYAFFLPLHSSEAFYFPAHFPSGSSSRDTSCETEENSEGQMCGVLWEGDPSHLHFTKICEPRDKAGKWQRE